MAGRDTRLGSRLRSGLLAAGLVLATVGCSSDYEGENVEALSPLNSLPGVLELGDASSSTGCTTDTCWFGNDITLTTVNIRFGVDVDEALPKIASALGADRYSEQDCSSPDADCLGGDRLIDFEFDDDRVRLLQLVVNGDHEGTITLDVRQPDGDDS